MSNWSTLPNEILPQIFGHFEGSLKELGQCQLVCQAWNLAAQELLYNTIIIKECQGTKKILNTITTSANQPGRFVKDIRLPGPAFQVNNVPLLDPVHLVALIAKHCPNVEIFYMPSNALIDNKMVEERKAGRLQKVRRLNLPEEGAQFLRASEVALVFRSTLEDLYLCDGATMDSPTPQKKYLDQCKKVVKVAEKYKNGITYLSLEIASTKSVFELESYTSKFPALNDILYIPKRPNLDIVDLEEGIEDLSVIEPYTKLTTFCGYCITLTDRSTIYFMHKYPCLRRIVLNYREVNMPLQYPFFLSQEVMLQFFEYATNIGHFDIYFKFDQTTLESVVRTYMEASAPKKDIVLMIMYSSDHQLDSYPYTRLALPSIYDYWKDSDINNSNANVMEVYYNRIDTVDEEEQVTLPHLELLDALGSRIKHILLRAGVKYHETRVRSWIDPAVELFEDELRPNLMQVVEKCPLLESLTIRQVDFYGIPSNTQIRNESLTSLEVQDSVFGPRGFEQFKVCLPNLRYLTLNDCKFLNVDGVDMPNSVLDNLTWKRSGAFEMRFVFHVQDMIGDEYLMMNVNGFKVITKQQFDSSLRSGIVCMAIKCEYVRTISISFSNYKATREAQYDEIKFYFCYGI
jgi:hypothetical protein